MLPSHKNLDPIKNIESYLENHLPSCLKFFVVWFFKNPGSVRFMTTGALTLERLYPKNFVGFQGATGLKSVVLQTSMEGYPLKIFCYYYIKWLQFQNKKCEQGVRFSAQIRQTVLLSLK